MFKDRFDGAMMAVFVSIEFSVLLGVSAWAAGDLLHVTPSVQHAMLAAAALATVAIATPICRRLLRPATTR